MTVSSDARTARPMHPNRLQCPHCSVVLRIRDRKLVGRQVDCPDCGAPIQVLADGPNKLQLAKVEDAGPADRHSTAATATAAAARPATEVKQPPASPTKRQNWSAKLTSSAGIGWSVAVLAGVVLLVIAWPFGGANSPETPPDHQNRDGNPNIAATPALEASNPSPQREEHAATVQSRMGQLGRSVMGFVESRERYPSSSSAAAGLTEEQRLSWIAELVADNEAQGGPQPLWDQSWRDPLNDRFVRRILSDFQNPNVGQLTGPEGYPATHFVGIAGVGPDAPRLPVTHRRAGVFGVNRRTRVDDVKDGLANTMMIAGVARSIGGWAGSGPGTMRPFTREPYVNGPDGFGTGEEQGMSVLMADGSVRFLSANTDPGIIRRMAAMADGFPLDVKVPGEPGDIPPNTDPPPEAEVLAGPDRENPAHQPDAEPGKPQPVVVAPVPPKVIDVAAMLMQRILSYEHPQATPLRVVLLEVEEMVGVPIRVDEKRLGTAAARLDEPITVERLEETTVGEILRTLVEQSGLSYAIDGNAIRIQAKE